MQRGVSDFDQQVDLFKQGNQLIKECREYLDKSELKIEQLIKEVEDQSKSSSSSSQQQQQQGQQNQQSQSQQQQSDQAQGTESQQAQGSERMPPPREREQLRSILDASSAAWGNLPAHYRDGLQQARDQYVSELYQRLTEAYYRKLAEEGSSKP